MKPTSNTIKDRCHSCLYGVVPRVGTELRLGRFGDGTGFESHVGHHIRFDVTQHGLCCKILKAANFRIDKLKIK